MASESFLRLPQVVARTGLSRSAIYSRIAAGEFPSQVKLGERSSAWLETEVQGWVEWVWRRTSMDSPDRTCHDDGYGGPIWDWEYDRFPWKKAQNSKTDEGFDA